MSNTLFYIGVMSGSSLDGIDVALTEITEHRCTVVATHFQAYSANTKESLLALHFPSKNELEQSALMANQLASYYAEAINALLEQNNLKPNQIRAIGCHGQTIRHQPTLNGSIGYTIQLGNNSLLAELTNTTVVGDFRSRDIAAGGQGAPLVPAFHQSAFASKDKSRAIVNIGGIANISYLKTSGDVMGFDSGPGNMLLDHWVKLKLGKSYDEDGTWSSTGTVQADLLKTMLSDPYFSLPPPKSTGRDLFNEAWLSQHIAKSNISDADSARTLLELTVTTVYQHLMQHCSEVNEVYVCGGGVHNQFLLACLKQRLGSTTMALTDDLGVNADWVEAAAFAWLAKQTITHRPGNLPAVTGANGLRILGAIHLA